MAQQKKKRALFSIELGPRATTAAGVAKNKIKRGPFGSSVTPFEQMIKAALRVGSKTDAPPLTHFSDFHPHPPLLERGATATGVSACVKAPPRLPSSPLAARPPALSSPPRQTRKSDWRGDGRRARAPPREKKKGG
mmetsp:Transcript_22537/g.50870  ORF Transcript_22537/g.50870 Transcript_22537/m.50870 type:complete len:136 (+) Transcript_22537:161-568(+)